MHTYTSGVGGGGREGKYLPTLFRKGRALPPPLPPLFKKGAFSPSFKICDVAVNRVLKKSIRGKVNHKTAKQ